MQTKGEAKEALTIPSAAKESTRAMRKENTLNSEKLNINEREDN